MYITIVYFCGTFCNYDFFLCVVLKRFWYRYLVLSKNLPGTICEQLPDTAEVSRVCEAQVPHSKVVAAVPAMLRLVQRGVH